ncbi:MAG: serine/threonine-protein kinase [bacterium]
MTSSNSDPAANVLRTHVQQSLGDSYTIERELGGGGMSRVYVARERALDRLVVVKVLPFDLAAGINTERFKREIQLVAGMQHPHIVPVLAAGDASGTPYYTMPFIKGESLRKRVEQHGMLSMSDALKVLYDVVDALAYAHEHGIVHRDIKPDNILMSGAHAVVTDFGVAKALSIANSATDTDGANLTGPSMAVGTPTYMAPEQAAGDPDTDHRADLYAWGLLAYELLAGEAPFGKRSAHEMLVAHIAEIPESLHVRNPKVPLALSDVVMRCLEKRPSDRPASAADIRNALGRPVTPIAGVPITRETRNRRLLRTALSCAAVAVVLAGAFAFRPRPRQLDERQVAVLPFSLVSADPSLRYLREGMLDLLAAKLTGEGGPRSVDPRTILSAWRRAAGADTADLARERALDLAEQVGAGQLLIGSISGNAQRLTITASLLRVRDGRADSPRSVSGPADSLPVLVDRLASELLALRAGEGDRLGTFAGVPLPALQAYLDGSALYRRAHFAAAAKQFDRAIGFDSTFALAGLGLATASGWAGNPSDRVRGVTIAWRHRDRLGIRDQALLLATTGPNFPGPASGAELIAAKQRYAALAPDRADAQFELADVLFHYGAAAGILDAHARAADGFNRTIALDSTFSPAMEHLIILELENGDSLKAAQLGALYLAADSASENRDGVRWAVAVAKRDAAGVRKVLDRRDSLNTMAMVTIEEAPRFLGREIESAQYVADTPTPKNAPPSRAWLDLMVRHDLALDRGRPQLALALLDSMRAVIAGSDNFDRVRDALFWDGDTTGAAAAAQALRAKAALGGPVPGTHQRGKDPVYFGDLCLAELWSLSQGDTSGARRVSGIMVANLDVHDTLSNPPFRKACALLLTAQLAVMELEPTARSAVDSLDAYLRSSPGEPIQAIGNLAAARLYERLGDTRAALFAVRRRYFFFGRAMFYSTTLRDEARLAEKAGDSAGAAEALRRYVAMRGSPEPALARDAAESRAALMRTGRAGAGK